MINYRKDFNSLPWQRVSKGLRSKEIRFNNKNLKLVEFNEDFIEEDWCENEHLGYILDGNCTVIFKNGNKIKYKKDDIITIPQGENDKHKAILAKGERIRILFFTI